MSVPMPVQGVRPKWLGRQTIQQEKVWNLAAGETFRLRRIPSYTDCEEGLQSLALGSSSDVPGGWTAVATELERILGPTQARLPGSLRPGELAYTCGNNLTSRVHLTC